MDDKAIAWLAQIDQSLEASKTLAAMVAQFWKSLQDSGVDRASATAITAAWAASIAGGIGRNEPT